MYRNSLLVYKLSYCLGLSDRTLSYDYDRIHKLATELHYFDDKPAVSNYRAAAHIAFVMMRDYDDCVLRHSLNALKVRDIRPYCSNVEFDPYLLFTISGSVDAAILAFLRKANSYIYRMYQELELGLSFEDFSTLVHFPDVSRRQILEAGFVLREYSEYYPIYFFNSPILNLKVKSMLSSDSHLIKRLSVIDGMRPLVCEDRSVMRRELLNMDDSSFVTVKDVCSFERVLLDASTISRTMLTMLSECSQVEVHNTLRECLDSLREDSTPENTAVLFKATGTTMEIATRYIQNTSVVTSLPVSKFLYSKIIERTWPHVYALSTRSKSDVEEPHSDSDSMESVAD